jgi:hypothetical protein
MKLRQGLDRREALLAGEALWILRNVSALPDAQSRAVRARGERTTRRRRALRDGVSCSRRASTMRSLSDCGTHVSGFSLRNIRLNSIALRPPRPASATRHRPGLRATSTMAETPTEALWGIARTPIDERVGRARSAPNSWTSTADAPFMTSACSVKPSAEAT